MDTKSSIKNSLCKLDPRIKLIFIVAFTSVTMITLSNLVLFWNYTLLLLLYIFSDKRLKGIQICIPAYVMVGLQCVCTISPENTVVGIVGFIVFFLSRLYMFFAIGYWFSVTTKAGEVISALQSMKLHQGIIISVVVFFRYMPTVGHEFWYIGSSMKLRGVGLNFSNVIKHPVRTVEYAFVPLIIRSFTIADRLSESAMTRGLNLENKRSNYRELHLGMSDWLICLAVCFLIVITIFIT